MALLTEMLRVKWRAPGPNAIQLKASTNASTATAASRAAQAGRSSPHKIMASPAPVNSTAPISVNTSAPGLMTWLLSTQPNAIRPPKQNRQPMRKTAMRSMVQGVAPAARSRLSASSRRRISSSGMAGV